jgi:hypothetical protein
MREGWWKDNYLVLFEESEIPVVTARYALSRFLPRYEIVGLCGWDDFLVRDSAGRVCSVPTVPANARHLEPFTLPTQDEKLETDVRFTGKIKWYIKPIVFGGDPAAEENMKWVDHGDHAQLVTF